VVSFMPPPLYSRGKNPRYPLDRRFSGPQSQSGHISGIRQQTGSTDLRMYVSCYRTAGVGKAVGETCKGCKIFELLSHCTASFSNFRNEAAWESNGRSASSEIPRFLWNLRIMTCEYIRVTYLRHVYIIPPVNDIVTPYFCKISSNIILPSTPTSASGLFLLSSPMEMFMHLW